MSSKSNILDDMRDDPSEGEKKIETYLTLAEGKTL